jgi:hypothetical protein
MNKQYIHTFRITSTVAEKIFEVMYDKFNVVQMFIISNY